MEANTNYPLPKASVSTPATAPLESSWRSAFRMGPFLFFCWLGVALFAGFCGLFYYLISPRLIVLSEPFNIVAMFILGGMIALIGGGLLLITITALTGIDLLYPHKKPSITVSLLFPLAVFLGRLVGYDRAKLRTSFVKVNNAMTKAQRKRIKGDKILVLLPHCLQIDVCNRKITGSVDNCVQCGRCTVGSLLEMARHFNLSMDVVNGGTLARRRVKQFKPDGILAVACERDLTLGILDVYPTPVYGVINDRPNGPCINTCVDMELVREGIAFFKNETGENPKKA